MDDTQQPYSLFSPSIWDASIATDKYHQTMEAIPSVPRLDSESLSLCSLSPRSSLSDSSVFAPEPSTSHGVIQSEPSTSHRVIHPETSMNHGVLSQALEYLQTLQSMQKLSGSSTMSNLSRASPPGIPVPAQNVSTRLFVARIPHTVDQETFRAYFSSFGMVLDAYLPRDKCTGAPRGIGFVTYATRLSVDVVLSVNHELHGNRLAVDLATQRA